MHSIKNAFKWARRPLLSKMLVSLLEKLMNKLPFKHEHFCSDLCIFLQITYCCIHIGGQNTLPLLKRSMS